MKRFDDAVWDAMVAISTRVPGKGVAIIAVFLYAGLGLALPIALNWSVPWLISANVVGTMLAASLSLVWFALQIEARDRRHLVEWTTDLRLLDSAEFEWLVGELFRRDGWKVVETGRRGAPDGNIDLRLARNDERAIVQCKRWQSWAVGVDDVRSFVGTLHGEGAKTIGIFVTLSSFTEQAAEEAKRLGLTLIDNRDLYARVERVRRPEPCERCGAAMILDRSVRGWWFRCVTRGCAGKRDLGSEPARAVELLTQPPN